MARPQWRPHWGPLWQSRRCCFVLKSRKSVPRKHQAPPTPLAGAVLETCRKRLVKSRPDARLVARANQIVGDQVAIIYKELSEQAVHAFNAGLVAPNGIQPFRKLEFQTGRSHQHYPVNPLGMACGECERQRPAEGIANKMCFLDLEPVHHANDVIDPEIERESLVPFALRTSEAGRIRRGDAKARTVQGCETRLQQDGLALLCGRGLGMTTNSQMALSPPKIGFAYEGVVQKVSCVSF